MPQPDAGVPVEMASKNWQRTNWRAPDAFAVATMLAANGFKIFPTQIKTKIPCIAGWPVRATTRPSVIAAWQRRFNPNWSILTGRENGVIVLDIDGDAGRVDLARLENELGPLPQTWRVKSGRVDGGEHIWLRPPPGDDDDLRNQQPIPGYKIDIRGWHGHVVVASSLHKSGALYEWARGCAPDECELAECPAAWWAWLPKKIPESENATPRERGARASRKPLHAAPHERGSRLIGDGPGFGGFQNPIFLCAIDWWREAGIDAREERLVAALWRAIEAAPKRAGRDLERYRPGAGDLERAVRRAREFVIELESELEIG